MANIELLLTRSSSPVKHLETSPQSKLRKGQGYLSDGEEGRLISPPPPDYNHFLSDNDLPSARLGRRRRGHTPRFTKSHGAVPSSSYCSVSRTVSNGNHDNNGEESESGFNDDDLSTLTSGPYESLLQDGKGNEGNREDDETLPLLPSEQKKRKRKEKFKKAYNFTRVALLAVLLVSAIIFFSIENEIEERYVLASVNNAEPHSYLSTEHDSQKWYGVRLHMRGPFYDMEYAGNTTGPSSFAADNEHGNPTNCSTFMVICVQEDGNSFNETENRTACELLIDNDKNCVSVQLLSDSEKLRSGEHSDDHVIKRMLTVSTKEKVKLNFYVSEPLNVHFEFAVNGEILSEYLQIALAGLTLVVVYVLIVFDLVHRTIAALVGSTVVLGVLSMLHKRPTLETAVEWLSLETICLLFGMMVLVAIFSQTGFFDYFAVKCYKLSRGRVWPLICLLCLFSAVVSAFLDNVTTILLLTPVSIRLCQVLNLDPVPVLISEVLFSNIGGTGTAIGDPPNVIIVSHELLTGINFAEFTLHLALGIFICTLTAYGILALFYYTLYVGRKDKDPPHIAELKREIAIWERTARFMPVVSLEERAVREALRTKAREVRDQLKEQRSLTNRSAVDLWKKNLEDLESRYKITDKVLLLKSSIVLGVVIIMFFFSHFIPGVEINLGWIAIFGALVLLILADIQELEGVLHKVEWGTLLFFAGLFVLMEGLAELGLMEFIGNITIDIVKNVEEDHQLLVAIILVLWVSAIVSSFIDNIPFTQAMIPVIVKLADSPEVCLPLKPLVWTLAFGACLGGNGTLIGASANVVCAGLAEQNGYKISFNGFFKMGFPMMLATTFTAMLYLLLCHVGFKWDAIECT